MTIIHSALVPIRTAHWRAGPRASLLSLLTGVFFALVPGAPSSAAASNDEVMACSLAPPAQVVAEASLGQHSEFGAAVALMQDPSRGGAVCAVGAPSAWSAGSPRGSVRIVVFDGQDGSLRPCSRIARGILAPRGLSSHSRFGAALDFGPVGPTSTLAVGAPGANTDGGSRAGLVRLYRVGMAAAAGPLPMMELAEFTPPPGSDGAAFGASVAFSPDGHQLAIGAPFAKSSGGPSLSGAVYVYGSEDGEWSLQFVATAPRPSAGATFGQALDWVGGTLVVGAPGDGELAPGAGRVYGVVGSGRARGTVRWEAAAPVAGGSAAGMRFGESLAGVDASTLAIGGWGRGLVEVLSVPAVGDPVHLDLLQGDPTEGFGLRVTAAGGTVYVAAPFARGAGPDPGGVPSAGRIDAFGRSGNSWVFSRSHRSAQPSANGEFGVAIDACTTASGSVHVLVGEPSSNFACPRWESCAAGAAFLF